MHATGREPTMEPSIAVVVATKNRWAQLEPLLNQLVALPIATSVVVVDQSEEGDRSRCAEWFAEQRLGHLRHLIEANMGLPCARNVGWRACDEAVVVFLDDDVTLMPGCLEAHLSAYTDDTVGGVAGRVRETPSAYNAQTLANRVLWYGRVWSQLDVEGHGDVESVKGANMSFRREVLVASGGFDAGFLGTHFLEESDLSKRVIRSGWRIRYVSEADLHHHRAPQGGCRAQSAGEYLTWRCHNIGRFLRKHHPVGGAVGGAVYTLWLSVNGALRARTAAPLVSGPLAYWTGWLNGKKESANA